MNYELALELKRAGFPQHRANYVDEHGWAHYKPSLSELVEACGDKFLNLSIDLGRNGQWMAFATDRVCEGRGQTPEEAIAYLWLMINKK